MFLFQLRIYLQKWGSFWDKRSVEFGAMGTDNYLLFQVTLYGIVVYFSGSGRSRRLLLGTRHTWTPIDSAIWFYLNMKNCGFYLSGCSQGWISQLAWATRSTEIACFYCFYVRHLFLLPCQILHKDLCSFHHCEKLYFGTTIWFSA